MLYRKQRREVDVLLVEVWKLELVFIVCAIDNGHWKHAWSTCCAIAGIYLNKISTTFLIAL